MSSKSILVLHAGGTIGMVAGTSGLVPGRRFIAQIEDWIGRQRDLHHHDYRIETLDPLIDSADAEPATWLALARRIWTMRDLIDAVVVLHGTDTMAYTASAASFFLIGLGKPVILTGAQLPFSVPDSDGEMNVLGALACAAEGSIREVCIFFDHKLMRGNRTRKWSTDKGDAFLSPHWPELARVEHGLHVAHEALLPPVAGSPSPPRSSGAHTAVGLVKLYPGMSDYVVSAAADAHPGGLVLELYGSGTGPAANKLMRRTLQGIAARGTPLIGVSQCFHGRMTPAIYASGRALAECGIANGYDLTPEAALTKLTYLQERDTSPDLVAAEMARALAGEITV
jgi:L-asparaginase